MNGDQLFENAVNMYNLWYKFFDRNYYTMQSYELFTKAKNKYLMSKNINRIISCYEWMIKCLQEVTNNYYNDDLAIVYDDFAYYLFNNNNIDKAIVLFQKATDIYNDSGNFSRIIKIKEYQTVNYKVK